jgi:hypothetical protein
MTKRPLLGCSRDDSPWAGSGGTAAPDRSPSAHEAVLVAGVWVCRGCDFRGIDMAEASAHIAGSQFTVRGGGTPAPAARRADEGGDA